MKSHRKPADEIAVTWTPEKLRELEAEILAWRPPSVTSPPHAIPNRLHGAHINDDGDAV